MPVGATLGAAGIGAATSIYGSSRAAGMQKRAAQQAQQTMRPYTETGAGAIQSLAQLYGIPTSQNPNPGMPFNEASMNAFIRHMAEEEFPLPENVPDATFKIPEWMQNP